MVALLCVAILSLQQVQIEVTVDRDRVMAGDNVQLTIRVEATGNEPVQIMNPPLVRLELLGSVDQSEVSIVEGVATRIFTRTLRLRAVGSGTARIGTTEVFLGAEVARADPLQIEVVASEVNAEEALPPHIIDLVDRHARRHLSADEVYVDVITSEDSIVLGEQLDLAVVAWFPQQVRAQLRTPPTLHPPELQGAWTYSHGVPHAVDVRRTVGGVPYHAYVHALVVFPLTPGMLEIGPATVSYSLPMSYSFLSREVRHEPQSETTFVSVADQPVETRPTQFDGAAGRGLRLSVDGTPANMRVGDAAALTVVVEGQGNVALWPEPRIQWPAGVRAYPEGTDVALASGDERVSGSKTFRYLVVADSTGTHSVESISYSYYDLDQARYVTLRSAELAIVSESMSDTPREHVGDTRVLMTSGQGGTLSLVRLADAVPVWGWIVLFVLPPAIAAAVVLIPKFRRVADGSGRSRHGSLEDLEEEFETALRDLVGGVAVRDKRELAATLRAAGVDPPIADHAGRVRERLWQANYGPEGGTDPDELVAEVAEVVRALGGGSPSEPTRAVVGKALFLFSLLVAAPLAGQSAERLYEAGALRSAADSFAARAREAPWSVAHMYNLGAAFERSGELQSARAAWIRAGRLAPRNRSVRAALAALPPIDPVSARMVKTAPVSAQEMILAGVLLWLTAWLLVMLRVKWRYTTPILCLSLACVGFGAHLHSRNSVFLALVAATETPLRTAPYGPADATRTLLEGMVVEIKRETEPWLLVERGREGGWVLADEVVPLR